MSDNLQNSVIEKNDVQQRRVFTVKATQLIWLLLGILEALLGLRIFLKLIGANPANPFAAFLYKLTELFVAPFAGLTSTPAVGNMVLEISTFIAMLVYGLIGWAAERLVWLIFYKPRV
jgi:uncharacterized protein YggT (Ycf19 family)